MFWYMQSNFLHSIPTYLMFNLTYEVLKDYRDGGTEPGMGKISGMRKQGRRVRGAKTTEGIVDLYGRTDGRWPRADWDGSDHRIADQGHVWRSETRFVVVCCGFTSQSERWPLVTRIFLFVGAQTEFWLSRLHFQIFTVLLFCPFVVLLQLVHSATLLWSGLLLWTSRASERRKTGITLCYYHAIPLRRRALIWIFFVVCKIWI